MRHIYGVMQWEELGMNGSKKIGSGKTDNNKADGNKTDNNETNGKSDKS